MRLYDRLLSLPGSLLDQAYHGSFTELAKDLRDAECFLLSPELTAACEQVSTAKPSTVLNALHHLRAPYPRMWLEWEPKERTLLARQNGKPVPKRMGCLLISDRQGSKGLAIYCWEHSVFPDNSMGIEEVTIDPFGIIFNWGDTSEPVIAQYAKHIGITIPEEHITQRYGDRESFRESLSHSHRWGKLCKDDKELQAYIDLEMGAAIVPLEQCRELFESDGGKNLLRPGLPMYDNFMEDLAGEFAYTQAVMMMLNTRNEVVKQTREDFSRLNKARAKSRKPPLKEYIVTSLNLSKVQGNRATSQGLSREDARMHLVRGHFKIRTSGVYWWGAHVRGSDIPSHRKEYRVNIFGG